MARTSVANRFLVRDFGSCLSFNGSTDFVDVATNLSTLSPTTGVTVAMWVKLSAQANTNTSPLRGASDEYGFLMGSTGAGNAIEFKVSRQSDGTQYGSGQQGAVLTRNVWYHLVGTAAPGVAPALYINTVAKNGTQTTMPGSDTIKTVTGHVYIGQEGGASRLFPGLIDDVRIYNRILSSDEIAALYYTGVNPSDVSTALLAQWNLDEGSGSTATDASGNGHSGTITGATYSTDVRSKPRTLATSRRLKVRDFGTNLFFGAATTDRIVKTNAAFAVWSGATDLTLSAWIKPTLFGDFYVFAYPDTAGNNRKYVVMTSSKNINFAAGTGTSTLLKSGLVTNMWYHVIVIDDRTNSQFRAYVNGVETLTWTAYTPGTATAQPIIVGNQSTGATKAFNGVIDDFCMWTRVLTTAEALDLYYEGITPTNNLLIRYKLDEGSGTTANDSSGNGFNGTITGASYVSDVRMIPRTLVS